MCAQAVPYPPTCTSSVLHKHTRRSSVLHKHTCFVLHTHTSSILYTSYGLSYTQALYHKHIHTDKQLLQEQTKAKRPLRRKLTIGAFVRGKGVKAPQSCSGGWVGGFFKEGAAICPRFHPHSFCRKRARKMWLLLWHPSKVSSEEPH